MHKAPFESIKWYIRQVKDSASEDIADGDNFTCIEFNHSGDLIAAGDKSGRVTIYHLNHDTGLYDLYYSFTSHVPEFDYLKSLEIEEKINSITWLPNPTSSHHLLSANDKTIKLWRLSESQLEAYNFNLRSDEGLEFYSEGSHYHDGFGPPIPRLSHLRVPKFRKTSHMTIEARPRRIFANAHTYHINAVSLNTDQELFLSADDLRINLWHLDVSNQSFTIVDLKPSNMEDLAEVITCARFHPVHCHLLAYSSSRGVIRLCDLRQGALCDNPVLVFMDPSLSQNSGFFADIIASLSDFRFGNASHYLLARDYLTLKVWDVRMGDRPCELYSVHEPFRSQLCRLYENDAIFDKFLCSWSADDRYAITGSYGNLFHLFDRHTGLDWLYDLTDAQITNSYIEQQLSEVASSSSLSISNAYNVDNSPLSPKRFISPEDLLGNQLGLTSIYVAPLDMVETLLCELNSPSSSQSSCSESPINDWDSSSKNNNIHEFAEDLNVDVDSTDTHLSSNDALSITTPTGSKRRKQVLPSRTNEQHTDTNTVSFSDAGLLRVHRKHSRHRQGRTKLLNESEDEHKITSKDMIWRRGSLPGMHSIDCQSKLLQLAWHPKEMLVTATSGNQLFVCKGVTATSCSSESSCPRMNDIKIMVCSYRSSETSDIDECEPVEVVCSTTLSSLTTEASLTSNGNQITDIKAPKRRRWRHYYNSNGETENEGCDVVHDNQLVKLTAKNGQLHDSNNPEEDCDGEGDDCSYEIEVSQKSPPTVPKLAHSQNKIKHDDELIREIRLISPVKTDSDKSLFVNDLKLHANPSQFMLDTSDRKS